MKRRHLASIAALCCAFVPFAEAADLAAVSAAPPGLWRGHFSGGINTDPSAPDIALGWVDQVALFPDDATCRHWLRDLRAQYPTYEGFHGCLRIR